MVTYKEILMGRIEFIDLPPKQQINLIELITRVNLVRGYYGKALIVSSGYRRISDNLRAGGANRSAHMSCEAVDFYDPNGEFAEWCLKNLALLEKIGLYLENPKVTVGWVHLQTRRPSSGKIVFDP